LGLVRVVDAGEGVLVGWRWEDRGFQGLG